MSSFYTSLSGLNAYNSEISTISNNIANMKTSGYKSTSLSFAEAISSVISGSSSSAVGNGVTVSSNSVNWTQGDLSETGNTYDLAISGAGFFLVQDNSGATYYTRQGSCIEDDTGSVVTDDGLALQGYKLNSDGSLGGLGDINLTSYQYAEPTVSTTISTTLNLTSGAATGGDHTATIESYDSLGNDIPIEIKFTKSATSNTWTWSASIDSSYGTAAGSGTLAFNSDGTLVDGTNPTISLNLANGAASSTLTWDIYGTTAGSATGTYASNGTVTQYSSGSLLSDSSTDGKSAGTLSGVSINENGILCGTYSNNEVLELYQVALATFTNTDGLTMATNGYYQATATSGSANIGVSGTGSYGTVASGYLESSNVDLSSEMTTMIIAQHAYEACSKLISVEEEMLKTLINAT